MKKPKQGYGEKSVTQIPRHGDKKEKVSPISKCETCGGVGTVYWDWDYPGYGSITAQAQCPDCKGTGEAPLQAELKADKPDRWYNITEGMWS